MQPPLSHGLPQPGLCGSPAGPDLHDELHLLDSLHCSGEIYHCLPSLLQGDNLMLAGCLYWVRHTLGILGKIAHERSLPHHHWETETAQILSIYLIWWSFMIITMNRFRSRALVSLRHFFLMVEGLKEGRMHFNYKNWYLALKKITWTRENFLSFTKSSAVNNF